MLNTHFSSHLQALNTTKTIYSLATIDSWKYIPNIFKISLFFQQIMQKKHYVHCNNIIHSSRRSMIHINILISWNNCKIDLWKTQGRSIRIIWGWRCRRSNPCCHAGHLTFWTDSRVASSLRGPLWRSRPDSVGRTRHRTSCLPTHFPCHGYWLSLVSVIIFFALVLRCSWI